MALQTQRRPRARSTVQTTYKIAPETKRTVALLAEAFGLSNSRVVEQAVSRLAKDERSVLTTFLRESQSHLDGLDDGEVFSGKAKPKRYVGGPATTPE